MNKMTQTTARIKKKGKEFEIIVDLEKAMKFKNGEPVYDFLEIDWIYRDVKKGFVASKEELEEAFGTEDVNEIAQKIVKEGEVLLTKEYRDEERERKLRQIADFLSKNSIDPQTGNPHSLERIKSALEEAHISIKNIPIESQINEIVQALSKIMPIKIETKKIKVRIPAIYTGKAYGIISQFKEKEEWLEDGTLEAILNVPAGMIIDFYEKLNSTTHGSVITEEIKE